MMDDMQRTVWGAKFNANFPEYASWLLALKSDDEKQAQSEAWKLCLRDVDQRDAEVVLERLIVGDDVLPSEWQDRSRYPALVRKLCKDQSARRAARDQRRQVRDGRHPIAGGSAAALYLEIVALKDSGMSHADAVRQVMDAQPDIDADREPRYRCLTCRDDGWALVWHTVAIQAVLSGYFDPLRHSLSMVVPCACGRGRERVKPDKWDESAVYSQKRYCLYGNGECDGLKDWVAVKQAEFWESKRCKDFDGFNNRQVSATEAF